MIYLSDTTTNSVNIPEIKGYIIFVIKLVETVVSAHVTNILDE